MLLLLREGDGGCVLGVYRVPRSKGYAVCWVCQQVSYGPTLYHVYMTHIYLSNWSSESHSALHEMEEIEHSKMETQDHFVDIDYSKFQASTISSSPSQYNYLDPNFCPAL